MYTDNDKELELKGEDEEDYGSESESPEIDHDMEDFMDGDDNMDGEEQKQGEPNKKKG